MDWRFAVIGDPIEHSLSPRLHTYLMWKCNISGTYSRIRVRDKPELEGVIGKLRRNELNGINITAPWKSEAFNRMDELSPEAKSAGVINTIQSNDGTLVGHNTDIYGVSESLKQSFDMSNVDSATVIGAGGASRAVLLALDAINIERVYLVNRTIANAEELVMSLSLSNEPKINALDETHLKNRLAESDLVINTLPYSARKIFDDIQIHSGEDESGKGYLDLLYPKKHLGLLRRMQSAGWTVQDGLDMLIYQGIAALEFWTGETVQSVVDISGLREHLRS
ncbi:MAG: shikimate dehydrogenase [Candidatus Marinimicrobia bacterium]|nr:shikimate dehydrogenase [Candidatus Neomarinimicrobiota bacterium]MCF7828247.1 shikimate dehydrogenase [Candidatus Neomarinimicrobiota bacterium]MCF7879578.1 shikimate dehydrogenase [Candidatus Neomarinimicrobiota bacterium]